jgi:hypothetical protein
MRGVGNSSPFLNFLSGSFNVAVGLVLLSNYPVIVGLNLGGPTIAAGALLLGAYLSRHFGKVRQRLNTRG